MQSPPSEERHIICVVRGAPPNREQVKGLLLELVGPARSEAGCLYYDVYHQRDAPDTFYIVDGWASDAAVAAHTTHPNVSRVVDQLLPLLASPLGRDDEQSGERSAVSYPTLDAVSSGQTFNGAIVMSSEPTAIQKMIGDFSPKLAELTDQVLFGDVWERPGLSKRDRSLVTVSALIALNRPEQIRHHIQRARDNGVTKGEVIEMITHLAFYAGWPSAMTAILIAKELFE